MVCNGKKYFEKVTINQIKKSRGSTWRLYSRSSEEQLYLLSRFPTFKGVKGLIPRKDYSLSNLSGCLGTHGLLYKPGDLAVISSYLLSIIYSRKKSVNLKDLVSVPPFYRGLYINWWPELVLKLRLLGFPPYYFHPLLPPFGNSTVSYNAYDFSDKYLRGQIGEMIFAKVFHYNKQAFSFIQDLIELIMEKAKKENLKQLKEFVDFFKKYPYEGKEKKDPEKSPEKIYHEGGGFGLVYTVIDLEEIR